MFDLEQSIAEWRRQMLAAGIKSPVPLEELECHLREDVERRVQSGGNLRAAFEAAVRQMGQPDELKFEFGKVGATRGAPARVRQAMRTLAGIPNHYQDTTMNTTDLNSNLVGR